MSTNTKWYALWNMECTKKKHSTVHRGNCLNSCGRLAKGKVKDFFHRFWMHFFVVVVQKLTMNLKLHPLSCGWISLLHFSMWNYLPALARRHWSEIVFFILTEVIKTCNTAVYINILCLVFWNHVQQSHDRYTNPMLRIIRW